MAFDDAATPLQPAAAGSAQPFGQTAMPSMEMRPLSTGELLDRTFFLYRSRILLFLSIALVPSAISFLGQLFGLVLLHPKTINTNISKASAAVFLQSFTASIGPTLVIDLLVLFGYAVCQAATMRLVSQLYLQGRGFPGRALKESLPHTLRYVGIELWKVWSAMWVPVVLSIPIIALTAGLAAAGAGKVFPVAILFLLFPLAAIYGLIAYIRNSLAVPASVIENLPIRAAMRRSKQLVAGRKMRIFLLFLLVALLYLVGLAVQSPLFVLVAKAKAPVQHTVAMVLTIGVSALVSMFLTPVASIALCLFYFDERVRREGFDIDFLLHGAAAALPQQSTGLEGATPATPSEAGNL